MIEGLNTTELDLSRIEDELHGGVEYPSAGEPAKITPQEQASDPLVRVLSTCDSPCFLRV